MEHKEPITPTLISVDLISYNEGQIPGVNYNPREITADNFIKLKQQISDYPEMLEYRGLMIYPYDGLYVAIGGNQRLRALRELGIEKAPCYIIPEDTPAEDLNAFQILDNVPFGAWDYTKLQNWDTSQLAGFNISVPVPEDSLNLDEFFEEGEDDTKTKIIVLLPTDKQHLKDQIKETLKSIITDNKYLGVKVK